MDTSSVSLACSSFAGAPAFLQQQNLDDRSFLLGQRAALQLCFSEALPAREALGTLSCEVALLKSSCASDALALHSLLQSRGAADACLAAADTRLRDLETRRVVAVEEAVAGTRTALELLRADVTRLEVAATAPSSAPLRAAALLAARRALAALAPASLLPRLASSLLCEPNAAAQTPSHSRRLVD